MRAPEPEGLTRRAGSWSDGPSLDVLIILAAKRLVLGVDVAAAKFASGEPINDPVREKVIMDWVSNKMRNMGFGTEIGIAFFRDQIEANKVIQLGLYRHWHANPEEFIASRRSLDSEIRPQLDLINSHMLSVVSGIDHMPRVQFSFIEELFESRLSTSPSLEMLDELRREAVTVALRSVYEVF